MLHFWLLEKLNEKLKLIKNIKQLQNNKRNTKTINTKNVNKTCMFLVEIYV